MAITKSLSQDEEKKRKKFFSKGKERADYTNILVSLPTSMLFQIEKIKPDWQTRNSWVVDAIDKKIKEGGFNA